MNLFRIFSGGKKRIHVLGDSHVEPLDAIYLSCCKTERKMCCIQGATASGLQNPQSKTLAGPIFYQYVKENIGKKDWVLVHLGEVDCGFLIWVRAEREKMTVSEQLKMTLENYFKLADEIRNYTRNLVMMSVIPPTIRDNTAFGNVANLRAQITATQLERTQLTLEMSEAIRTYCKKNKVHFLDLNPELIDPQTGVVKEEFRNTNPENHHLDSAKLTKLVSQKLEKIIC